MSRQVKINGREVIIEDSYNPLQDSQDQYMSDKQRGYFKILLESTLEEITNANQKIDNDIRELEKNMNLSDEGDRAQYEDQLSQKIRERSRNVNKMQKVLNAITSINHGTYGYCSATGEEIGIPRLMARPYTDLCVQAQEMKDRRNKQLENAIENENSAKSYIED